MILKMHQFCFDNKIGSNQLPLLKEFLQSFKRAEPMLYTNGDLSGPLRTSRNKHSISSAGKCWLLAMCKELGRLFQGFTCKLEAIHTVKGTNTCVFISSKDIPKGNKAT
jgi:hypothetical protein